MKIEREVNGQKLEFELTNRELFHAYCEQEHIWDMADIDAHLDDDDELRSDMDGLAYFVREWLNDSDYLNDAKYDQIGYAIDEWRNDHEN